MNGTELGSQETPREQQNPLTGGDASSGSVSPSGTERSAAASAAKSRSRRSPVYAEFETIDSAADSATQTAVVEGGLNLAAEFDNLVKSFTEGQIVKGTVTEIRENEIIVDVGFKSEGTIPVAEFRGFPNLAPGIQVDVFLEKLENQDGLVVLSKEKADFFKVWDEIKDGYEAQRVMEGAVARRIKGGLVVNLLGVDAFLPGSQIALRQVSNLDDLIGQSLNFKIIKINKRRRNIVVSRRIVLEEQREEQKKTLLRELVVAQIREGVVKNITDFGAFVDLGGVDGLLHLTDMTWGRIGHPSEIVSIGDKIKVKVLDFDTERGKISLGLKQLTPHPWDGVDERYIVNERVNGKVVSITDYGAFIELEKGVEGLIHISEMSWTRHVKHPSKILSIGEMIEAVVLKVDKEHQKISLGLKQVEPDPWSLIEGKYPIGTRIVGKVRNLTNFGAFVEIEEGIDGLLHISDMSWAKRVRHPSEMLHKGDELEVIVLDISQDKKRISLGMKQLQDNPWDSLASEFSVETVTEGKITRILDRGAVVELRSDVEGFVPVGQMGIADLKHPEEAFDVGDTLPLKVIKVDPKNKRIVLSAGAYLKGVSSEELSEFLSRHPIRERRIELAEETAEGDASAASDGGSEREAAPDEGPENAEPRGEEARVAAVPVPSGETHDDADFDDAVEDETEEDKS